MSDKGTKESVQRLMTNIKKQDEILTKLTQNLNELRAKKDTLTEEVNKLKDQCVTVDREVSTSYQLVSVLKQEYSMKLKESKEISLETEQLKWKYAWHDIIAKNQSAELKCQYDKIANFIKSKEMNEMDNFEKKIKQENKVVVKIQDITSENSETENEIKTLKIGLPTDSDVEVLQKEVITLQDRNRRIVIQKKCQLAELQRRISQANAYLNNMRNNTVHK